MPAFTGYNNCAETEYEGSLFASDLFSAPVMETSTQRVRESTYRPLSLNPMGPFEFRIVPESSLYLNPNRIRLSGSYQVKKLDQYGNFVELDSNDRVAPVNSAVHSFFRTIECDLNGKLVSFPFSLPPFLPPFLSLKTA